MPQKAPQDIVMLVHDLTWKSFLMLEYINKRKQQQHDGGGIQMEHKAIKYVSGSFFVFV